ncbi:MAG: cytochrome c oxidase subunit II [Candidatus Dormibacteria bacterium]
MRNRATAIRVVVIVWIVAAVGGDVGLALGPIPPGQASDLASSESLVILVLSVIAWPVFSGVLAALFFTLVVNRLAPPTAEVSADALRGNTRVQTTWIATTLVIVLSLAVYGTVELAIDQPGAGISTTSASLPMPASQDQPLEVQVIAQQWWFTYRYPTYGGIETAQLVLPVNQKIEFHITSLDVIHSFWFFALGVKADAVPLNDNVVTAIPTQVGTYRVQCSELCGLWHGNMTDDTAMVVSTSDFATWIQQQTTLDAPVMKYLPPYSHIYAGSNLPQPGVYAP